MMKNKKHCTLILLAGGRGKRMGSAIPKQFIEIDGKPVIWYSLKAAEESEIIDECVLVVHPDDADYVRRDIIDKYSFSKVKHFAHSGCERYESVWSGLASLAGVNWGELTEEEKREILKKDLLVNDIATDIVFIHDGARPFVNERIFNNCYTGAVEYGACAAAVRSKDTVKIVAEDETIISTPDRKTLWNMQTPQTFDAGLIFESYRKVMAMDSIAITDDAQAVEIMGGRKVHVVEGDYSNIKVTTPDDLMYAKAIIRNMNDIS